MKSSANSSSTRYWRFTFAVAMAVGLLAGCSVLTSPKEQPVIEDKVGGSIRTLSVTAERRAIIFGAKSDLRKGDQICAEPSPDIAESLVSSLKVIAEATAKKGVADTNANLEINKTLATAIATLFTRSQGVQFFRDNIYALCQAHMNGSLDEKQFANEFTRISNLSATLIEQEIPDAIVRRTDAAATRAEQARDAATQSAAAAKTSQTEAKASETAAAALAAKTTK